jgi:flavin reductase (DIM6/NTAB) family NADH-FMN oxidoreductase RutF
MLEPDLVNRVTWKIPNALALVGSRFDDTWNGMTTSWITQVSQEPVLIGIGVDKDSVTHGLISRGGAFSVNLWDAENTRPFVKFSKPATKDGMALNGYAITEGETGVPIFDDAIAWMECSVRDAIDCGTHTFFIGELRAASVNDDEARPASMADTRMKYGGTRRGH